MDMNCPGCGLELYIGAVSETVENGETVTVQQLFCRNPNCDVCRRREVAKERTVKA